MQLILLKQMLQSNLGIYHQIIIHCFINLRFYSAGIKLAGHCGILHSPRHIGCWVGEPVLSGRRLGVVGAGKRWWDGTGDC